jgi:hypothetical protein
MNLRTHKRPACAGMARRFAAWGGHAVAIGWAWTRLRDGGRGLVRGKSRARWVRVAGLR